MSERLLIVGDTLLDRDLEGHSERLCPDAPVPVVDQSASRARPGGAGLAACLAAADGVPVTLITAIAGDAAGAELRRALLAHGVDLLDLGLAGATSEKIRILNRGAPLLRLDRGGGGRVGSAVPPATLRAAIEAAGAVLVSDYGRGVAADPVLRQALLERPAGQPLIWDPHPRGAVPVAGTTLATPNLAEAARFTGRPLDDGGELISELANELRHAWQAKGVCVTCGEDGALMVETDGIVLTCAAQAVAGDPCGAGDRFAAEAALVLAEGGSSEEAVAAAVAAASGFVAAGGAGSALDSGEAPALREAVEQGVGAAPLSIEPALRLAQRVRSQGGAVVATGGCFDLLHVGHLHTLEAARELGDCLVVLLNSDRSVRRLKGSERPLVGELERAALLEGLACVDEVVIFDEETPVEALRLLRPDVWAKGGDYASEQLTESASVASWGGRTAILPHLEGRSTTKLIEKVGHK